MRAGRVKESALFLKFEHSAVLTALHRAGYFVDIDAHKRYNI